jgi:hypothetical protein
MSKTVVASSDEFVPLNTAQTLSGYSAYRIQQLASIGKIRTRVLYGKTPRYSVQDLITIKNEHEGEKK